LLLNVSSYVYVNEGRSLGKRSRKKLASIFPNESSLSVYNSFDIIGNIAIIKTPSRSTAKIEDVADAIMNLHRNVKAVFEQVSAVKGDFRLRRLIHVSGENRTRTVHKESGCRFAVDVEACYFSPRLSHERLRIAQLVKPEETVVNMFAGVGCFSILIAKNVSTVKVFSVDVNPVAVQFMTENIRINRVYGKVIPLLGDSKIIIEGKLHHIADRILMPLPEKALEYLPTAVLALNSSGGWIHYYDFLHAKKGESPVKETKLKVAEKMAEIGVTCEFCNSRVVRRVGPNWHQVVLDIHVMGVPHKS
jgi:tRNA (guanine37-N1)-methyltransferase